MESTQSTFTAATDTSQIECPICIEEFREPKVLKCGHSFCAVCIPRDSTTYVICPSCRTKTETPPNDLPTNFALQELMEKLKTEKSRLWCCSECGKYDTLQHFWACVKCDKEYICSTCAIQKHPSDNEHERQPMTAVMEKRENELSQCKERIQNCKDKIDSTGHQIKADLHSIDEEIKNIQAHFKQEMFPNFEAALSTINQVSQRSMDELKRVDISNRERLNDSLKKLSALIEKCYSEQEGLQVHAAASLAAIRNFVAVIRGPGIHQSKATIHWKVANVSSLKFGESLYSPPHTILGLPWGITLSKKSDTFEMFLYCDRERTSSTKWSCVVRCTLRLLSQDTATGHKTYYFEAPYCWKTHTRGWGSPNFVKAETLLDEASGFIKDGASILEADVSVHILHHSDDNGVI